MIRCLLLGASCVGKSSLGLEVCHRLNWKFADLDSVLRETYGPATLASSMQTWGPEGFYQRSLSCLEHLHQAQEPRLVAVGAASQLAAGESGELLQWPSVCLWTQPEQLWERSRALRQDPRSFEAFYAVEFNHWRQELYTATDDFLDLTGLSFDEAVDKLWAALTTLTSSARYADPERCD